jgi:hypothetical protein
MSAVIIISGRGPECSITARWSGITAAHWLEIHLFWYVRDLEAALPTSAPNWLWRYPGRFILCQQTVGVHRIQEPGPDGSVTIAMVLPADPAAGPIARGYIHWAVELVAARSRWGGPELLARESADGLPESVPPPNG